MKAFEILEHKADTRVRVFGNSREDIFVGSLLAMNEILGPEISGEDVSREIRVESTDISTLLVDFLNEVLFLGQTNKESYRHITLVLLNDNVFEGQVMGRKVKRFNNDIKAATYHNLKFFEKGDGKWEAEIIFDV